ncbi:hypothetical protein PGB90_003320 [Kerria lacca]
MRTKYSLSKFNEFVRIPFGDSTIQGVTYKSASGKKYYGFLGVPYAKPPLGDLRFRPPEPVESYPAEIDATKQKNCCLQKRIIKYPHETIFGSEDCLYMNIFIPELPNKDKPPKGIFFNISGGGFLRTVGGIGYVIRPNVLIENDIIFINFSYRVHIFGFLNLGIKECPGNAALKDQLMALKWVIKYIHNFGGDPNNITVHGTSAGAVCAHYFTMSPLSRGLFQKAIISSAHALVCWALIKDPEKHAFNFGRFVGYNGDDKKELLAHLKKMTADELLQAVWNTRKTMETIMLKYLGGSIFSPSLESYQEGAFLPESPLLMWKQVHSISILSGTCENEGSILTRNKTTAEDFIVRSSITALMRSFLRENFGLEQDALNEMFEEIENFYFGDIDEMSEEVFPRFMKYGSDFLLKEWYTHFNFMRKGGIEKTYNYLFTYEGTFNLPKVFLTSRFPVSVKGTYHSDECEYVMEYGETTAVMREQDKRMSQKICLLWANFVKTGNPNSEEVEVEWKNATIENPGYLQIDNELKYIPEELFEKRTKFWRYIMNKYALF